MCIRDSRPARHHPAQYELPRARRTPGPRARRLVSSCVSWPQSLGRAGVRTSRAPRPVEAATWHHAGGPELL
eukprot:7944989-Alexandrium_andersonii.AAC.1